MDSWLIWLETTAFSVWMRESISLFAFPGILSVHTVGMGLLAGINGAVDLRIMGVAPGVPLMELKRFFPLMWFGFWINALSGVALFIGYPTKAVTNPLFYFKLLLILLAMLLLRKIRRRVFGDAGNDMAPVAANGRMLAAVSLALWIGVITSGRLLAYTYSKLTSI